MAFNAPSRSMTATFFDGWFVTIHTCTFMQVRIALAGNGALEPCNVRSGRYRCSTF